MSDPSTKPFVSRGGEKLDAALTHFDVDVTGLICADLGSHVGGFVDCLLRHGAAKVYSVDTSYGTLAWTLRKDDRVVVMERTNAIHVVLPEPVSLVTIDAGWTKQATILPNVAKMLATDGQVITLIKPHYEADKDQLVKGVLPDDCVEDVVARTLDQIRALGWTIMGTVESPLRGHGGNKEVLARLHRA